MVLRADQLMRGALDLGQAGYHTVFGWNGGRSRAHVVGDLRSPLNTHMYVLALVSYDM